MLNIIGNHWINEGDVFMIHCLIPEHINIHKHNMEQWTQLYDTTFNIIDYEVWIYSVMVALLHASPPRRNDLNEPSRSLYRISGGTEYGMYAKFTRSSCWMRRRCVSLNSFLCPLSLGVTSSVMKMFWFLYWFFLRSLIGRQFYLPCFELCGDYIRSFVWWVSWYFRSCPERRSLILSDQWCWWYLR